MVKLKLTLISLLTTLLLCSNAFGNQSEEVKEKNILILFAQVPSTPAYRILLDGIRQKLDEEYGENYYLHTEYLEIERYPKGDYPKERFDLYNSKYDQLKLDLLICIGIDIIATVKDLASSQILNLPTISIDIDLSGIGNNNNPVLNDKTTTLGLKLNIRRTIDDALKLFPGTSSIYFLCGVARTDSVFMYLSQKEAERLKATKKVVFITNISMDEALRKFRHLPANSLIVLSSFTTDSRHVPYFNYESTRLISKVANAPVIAYSDIGFGAGALGGYFLSFERAGTLAGITSIKILKGTEPKTIQFTEADFYDHAYDWRQLNRWHLENSSLIPGESKVLFKEEDFIASYGWQIVFVILFVILETILIVLLLRANRRQKEFLQQKAETEILYRKIIREDRLLRMVELTASLSHELNQPLTAILYSAQAGKRFLESGKLDSAQANEIFDNIIEDDKRAGSVITSVRSLMKSENREMETLNIHEVIQDTVTIYHSEALQNNIRIRVSQPEKPVFVSGDRIQLQQVLLNLFSNSARAMHSTVTDKKIIEIYQLINHGSVTVTVRDYGKGINAEIQDKLFKPFVTDHKSGLGIGLSISRSIIERHGGIIKAENIEGEGAIFSFTLKTIKKDE
jgi:signal transduction histidine kinase